MGIVGLHRRISPKLPRLFMNAMIVQQRIISLDNLRVRVNIRKQLIFMLTEDATTIPYDWLGVLALMPNLCVLRSNPQLHSCLIALLTLRAKVNSTKPYNFITKEVICHAH